MTMEGPIDRIATSPRPTCQTVDIPRTMTSTKETKDPRSLKGIVAILDLLEENSAKFEVPPKMLKEIRGYLSTGPLIPPSLSSDDDRSVRKAQSSLQVLQSRLDRIIVFHFAVRNRLELLMQLEIRAKHVLLGCGAMTKAASKPAVTLALIRVMPELIEARERWSEMEKMLAMAQRHMEGAKDVIKTQMKLDDNVRWAQYRT